jgi:hypothetical protein
VDELHVVTRKVWDAVSLAAGKRDRSLTLDLAVAAVMAYAAASTVETGRRSLCSLDRHWRRHPSGPVPRLQPQPRPAVRVQ